MMMYNDNHYYQQQEECSSAAYPVLNTTTNLGATTSYYSYNEPTGNKEQQQGQFYQQLGEVEEDWNIMDLDDEEACYAQYDLDMANAVVEADYQDYYYEQQQKDDDYNEEDYYYDEEEDTTPSSSYDYQSDSLLSLVVGVQSYLTEQQSNSSKGTKEDSPLYNLQYKMYTFMRQRALELGVQL